MKICPVAAKFINADGRTDRQADRHDDANSLFYVLLTVHLGVILVTDQINAQILVL